MTTEKVESGGKSKHGCLLLGLLAALLGILFVLFFFPGFIAAKRSAKKRACITNLRHIEDACWSWKVGANKALRDTYSLTEPSVLAYMKGSALPICPAGGRYTPGPNFAHNPRCNIPGHTL